MIHQNNNGADNFFATATKEELVDYLVNKIHKEVEKEDGADCDLIRECSDWLDELTKDEVIFTPEELKQNLEKIKANVLSDKHTKNRKRFSAKTFVRVALIAAVIFTISILSLSVVASNKGYDSTWEYISASVYKLIGLDHGESITVKGITVIKNTETVQYHNMEELLASESLEILYPQVMPDKITITSLRYVYKAADKYTLRLTFSNNSYAFDISNYYSIDVLELNNYEIISINSLDFYIMPKDEHTYFALLHTNGYEYTIKSPDYDTLLLIIHNLKG